MSSSPADLRDAIAAQPPTPPSLARLSLPAVPRGACLPLPPRSPLAPHCFPFAARRLRGFDHLRLINYDAQLSLPPREKQRKKGPLFQLLPRGPVLSTGLRFPRRAALPHRFAHPARTKPSLCRRWAPASPGCKHMLIFKRKRHYRLQQDRSRTETRRPSCQAPELLLRRWRNALPQPRLQ